LNWNKNGSNLSLPDAPGVCHAPQQPPRSTCPDAGPAPEAQKLEGGQRFVLSTPFQPAGDQPTAIAELAQGVNAGDRDQVLLGATGTGKTFTMAKVIEETQRPAIILAPNKTLAAQLYGEFKGFFPDNAVEYFVSYYDYYQPEAYVARTDTYIEKESQINEQIDRMRHSATRALLERDDVIIVASVSCIYGIGSVETYSAMTQDLIVGQLYDQRKVMAELVAQQYRRLETAFQRGAFRVRGDSLEVWPAHLEDRAWRFSFFGEELESIVEFDPLTGAKTDNFKQIRIYANSHYVTPRPTLQQAIKGIKEELFHRLKQLESEGKLLEAQRLGQRTNFDLEMLEATGSCAGIENYSRYLTGRAPGEPPPTLFEFIPDNAIVFADESHVSVPQIGGMYRGDFRRKFTLAEHGFRLPSCMDNRPPEVRGMGRDAPAIVFVSATPAAWETGADRRRLHRTGDPPHRPARPTRRNPPGGDAGRRPSRRDPQGFRPRPAYPRHRPDQTHGRGPDRLPSRTGHPGALHALRHRHDRADRNPPRPAPRCLRRAGRASTSCARVSTSPNAGWWRSWMPTRRASCGPKPL
jgi:excinuclease ABC B subunit